MDNRQVRSLFSSENPRYYESLRLRSCLINSLQGLLPDTSSEIEILPSGSFLSESGGHSFQTDIELASSDQQRQIILPDARLTVPSGQALRITRFNNGDDEGHITAEALLNLETQDGGVHIGRTLYQLGKAAVEGKPLRQKTDSDISLYTEFATEYIQSVATAKSAGALAASEQITLETGFLSGPIKPAIGNAYAG